MRARWALRSIFFCVLFLASNALAEQTILDSQGRSVRVPDRAERVLCSGPGCLRLLSYLQALDLVVGVDSVERPGAFEDSRPYALANPGLKQLPLFGESKGLDNAELIMALDPKPQVIFKTFASMGHDAQLLQDKTGIPVVALHYGNLTYARPQLDRTLTLMAQITGRQERAKAVIAFLDATRNDLQNRVKDAPERNKRSCYIGGVAMRGGHGFQATDPSYAPFAFVDAANVAAEAGSKDLDISHASVAKEQIVAWDPEFIFVDVSTTQLEGQAGGLYELKHNPIYQGVRAVREGRVYGLLACNSYAQNYESVQANAYFVGKLLYPDRFADIDPKAKADEIYSFMVGAPVFAKLHLAAHDLLFAAAPLR
jgi:iron complex transport system substrate-binding protein